MYLLLDERVCCNCLINHRRDVLRLDFRRLLNLQRVPIETIRASDGSIF